MIAKIPFMVKEARDYSGREAEAPSSVNSLGPVTCMDSGIEVVEERLNSFTSQLQSECAILERIVYKNKNQHRSLKMRKCDGGKYNFMEWLLGALRLLSEMVELMLKAAMHPSFVG